MYASLKEDMRFVRNALKTKVDGEECAALERRVALSRRGLVTDPHARSFGIAKQIPTDESERRILPCGPIIAEESFRVFILPRLLSRRSLAD